MTAHASRPTSTRSAGSCSSGFSSSKSRFLTQLPLHSRTQITMAPSNTTPNDALEPTDIQESALNHPGGQSGDESVKQNPISERESPRCLSSSQPRLTLHHRRAEELAEISTDNIIDDEPRSARPDNFKGDEELDAAVEEVAKNDGELQAGFDDRRALADVSPISAEGMA